LVVFHALSTEELGKIVDIQLLVLGRRLAKRRLTLDVTEAAREWLAMNGFDPVFGARPLRRLVQSSIGDSLAKALLAGDITDGDTVVVDLNDAKDGLSVSRAR
jgi:ATP-dependent Clp protease ATP-binding subunit ClpB